MALVHRVVDRGDTATRLCTQRGIVVCDTRALPRTPRRAIASRRGPWTSRVRRSLPTRCPRPPRTRARSAPGSDAGGIARHPDGEGASARSLNAANGSLRVARARARGDASVHGSALRRRAREDDARAEAQEQVRAARTRTGTSARVAASPGGGARRGEIRHASDNRQSQSPPPRVSRIPSGARPAAPRASATGSADVAAGVSAPPARSRARGSRRRPRSTRRDRARGERRIHQSAATRRGGRRAGTRRHLSATKPLPHHGLTPSLKFSFSRNVVCSRQSGASFCSSPSRCSR